MNEKIVKESILNIENRNNLTLSGVQKVVSFSPTQIILNVLDSNMQICGEQMQTTLLDEQNGKLVVLGLINSVKWTNKQEKIGIIKRIFRWFFMKH